MSWRRCRPKLRREVDRTSCARHCRRTALHRRLRTICRHRLIDLRIRRIGVRIRPRITPSIIRHRTIRFVRRPADRRPARTFIL